MPTVVKQLICDDDADAPTTVHPVATYARGLHTGPYATDTSRSFTPLTLDDGGPKFSPFRYTS
jgi:hypothetical protein